MSVLFCTRTDCLGHFNYVTLFNGVAILQDISIAVWYIFIVFERTYHIYMIFNLLVLAYWCDLYFIYQWFCVIWRTLFHILGLFLVRFNSLSWQMTSWKFNLTVTYILQSLCCILATFWLISFILIMTVQFEWWTYKYLNINMACIWR